MKKLYYLTFTIFISVGFFSCSKENKLQDKINEYVEKNFNDPKSYELIELKFIDTLTRKRAAKYMIQQREDTINAIDEYVKEKKKEISDKAMSLFLGGPGLGVQEEVDKLKEEEAKLSEYNDRILYYQKENNRMKKYLSENGIVYFRYQHNYRTKNDSGVLIKYTDTLRFDQNDNIIEDKNAYILKNLEEKRK